MRQKVIYILLVPAFIVGQAMMFSGKLLLAPGTVFSAAAVACALAVFFKLKLPRTAIQGGAPALAALAAAAFSAALIRFSFPAALAAAFASAAFFFFFKKRSLVRPAFEEPRMADINPAPFLDWEPFFLIALAAAVYFTRIYGAGDFPAGAVEHEGRIALNALGLSAMNYYVPYIADQHANWSSTLFYQALFAGEIFGWSAAGLRLVPALYGFLSVIALYFTARKITSPIAAAVASVLYASSGLHMAISRQLFPGSMLFLPGVLALSFFMDGMRKNNGWLWFLLSGFSTGYALHGYFAGRIIPFMAAAWMIWVFAVIRKDRLPMAGIAAFAAGFYLCAWPVINFAVLHPSQFSNYISAMGYFRGGIAAAAGEFFKKLAELVPINLGAFFRSGTIDFSLHMPYEPLVEPVSMYFFAAGMAVLVFSLSKPVPAYLLFFLAAGFLPSLMANSEFVARRSLMALPAIFLIAALPVEWLRKLLNKNNSGRRDAVLLCAGLAVAGCAFGFSAWKFFNVFCKSAGARLQYNYNLYLSEKEIEKHPAAACYMDKQVESAGLAGTAIFSNKVGPAEYTGAEAFFTLPAGGKNGVLLLVPPFMEGALGYIKDAYPGAEVSVFREKDPNDPYYPAVAGTSEPWLKYIDPFNKYVFLESVFITSRAVEAYHASLSNLHTGNRELVFSGGFGEKNRGGKMELGGIFVQKNGGELPRFIVKWPGWEVYVDAAPVKPGGYISSAGGTHYFRLTGFVPQNASGPLPFEIMSGKTNLVEEGRTGACLKPGGLKLSLWSGQKTWGNGSPLAARYEAFPAKRFYGDDGVGVPCSVRFEGFITPDADGEYEFYTQPFTLVKLRINNKTIYDNFLPQNPADARPDKIRLKKGVKVSFSADMFVPPARLGIETFVVFYKMDGQQQGNIAPFEWFSPY